MQIQHPNRHKDTLINKITGLLYRLENTGDSDYVRSGEAAFIEQIGKDYRDKDFVFFDVGANRGDYTEMILKKFSNRAIHAHLFEPQSSCVTHLQKKFNDNEHITINQFGLSHEVQETILYKNTDQSGLASVYHRNLKHHAITMDVEERISLQTGLHYVEENNISKIHLLKLDVEGHEKNVFNGFGAFLNPQNIDYIQFEYGGANLDSHTSLLELHQTLTAAGFILCKMMRSYLEIRPYHTRFENFMYQNWVAVSPELMR